jgi:hypothetical protein
MFTDDHGRLTYTRRSWWRGDQSNKTFQVTDICLYRSVPPYDSFNKEAVIVVPVINLKAADVRKDRP